MKKIVWVVVLFLPVLTGGIILEQEGRYRMPSDPGQVYYWYTDGTVSRGKTINPTAYPVNGKEYYSCVVPAAKKIIAVAIASNDRVYYWYDDNTTSIGTTDNPTKYSEVSHPPKGYYNSNRDKKKKLIGVGIAGNDRVYYWYGGGTTGWLSIGTTNDPTKHSRGICPDNSGYCKADILKKEGLQEPVAVAIDGFYDKVFYWYPDGTVSSGTSVNATKYRKYYNSNLKRQVVGIAIRNGK